jgi:hypothetical protein
LKTDDLVTMLATGDVAVEPNTAARRYLTALVWGTLGSAILMAMLLGVRPDLEIAVRLPMFWVKLAFVAVLALTSGVAALRLARPGSRLAWLPGMLAAPVVAMWVLATFVLTTAANSAERVELLFGDTAATCPFLIAMLSVPVFFAVIWAMQGLAPTRLRLAGAAVGLVSGSLGALVYAVHCPELAAPFLGLWYVLGMLIPAGVGAMLGPRLLRW